MAEPDERPAALKPRADDKTVGGAVASAVRPSKKRKAPAPIHVWSEDSEALNVEWSVVDAKAQEGTDAAAHQSHGWPPRAPTPFPETREGVSPGCESKRQRRIPQSVLQAVKGELESIDVRTDGYVSCLQRSAEEFDDVQRRELAAATKLANEYVRSAAETAETALAQIQIEIHVLCKTFSTIQERLQGVKQQADENMSRFRAEMENKELGMNARLADAEELTKVSLSIVTSELEERRKEVGLQMFELKNHFGVVEETVRWVEGKSTE